MVRYPVPVETSAEVDSAQVPDSVPPLSVIVKGAVNVDPLAFAKRIVLANAPLIVAPPLPAAGVSVAVPATT